MVIYTTRFHARELNCRATDSYISVWAQWLLILIGNDIRRENMEMQLRSEKIRAPRDFGRRGRMQKWLKEEGWGEESANERGMLGPAKI